MQLASVYGLYAGLKRTFLIPILLKNTRMNPGDISIRGREQKRRRAQEIASTDLSDRLVSALGPRRRLRRDGTRLDASRPWSRCGIHGRC